MARVTDRAFFAGSKCSLVVRSRLRQHQTRLTLNSELPRATPGLRAAIDLSSSSCSSEGQLMDISVVGLGYVGAVSAACLAEMGHRVWGVDINGDKVRLINEGRSPIVETGLADKIARGRQACRLFATVDIEQALRETEVCFVSVATPSRTNGRIDPAPCSAPAIRLLRPFRNSAGNRP